MSISWLRDVMPAPRVLVRPRGVAGLDEAHSAIELWEHYSRKTLDPAQRQAVEVMMATDRKGNWAASTTGRCMPRQNGKGDEIEVVELHGLVQRAEAILHTVHDAVLLASQTQQRMLGVLEGHKDLRRLKKRAWLGTGQQMIELHNGGIIWYRTRTGGGGRGVDDIDRLVVDEAQHAQEEHLSALTPTMLANSNAQLNALGSAGIEGKSDWWWQMRIRALGPDPGRFGFVEHTAEVVRLDGSGFPVQEEVDPTDRSVWLGANPAMHAGRGQGMPFLEEQFRRMDRRSFCREHLGVWDPPTLEGTSIVIPFDRWQACEDPESAFVGAPVVTVDVTPDRSRASIAASGLRKDGLPHVEVIQNDAGTAWVIPRLLALKTKPRRILVDATGPAGSLIAEGLAAGLTIEAVSAADHAKACGLLYDLAMQGRFRHGPDLVLEKALAGAVKRDLGDGAWLWSRKNSTVDISPLVAVTIALWAASETSKPVFAY